MAKSVSQNNQFVFWILVALLSGSFFGYFLAQSRPSYTNYRNAASLMSDNGTYLSQVGKTMMDSGTMIQTRGTRYNDKELIQSGKTLYTSGTMMQSRGTGMMNYSSGMMRMMGW